jgi:hypothetical protein
MDPPLTALKFALDMLMTELREEQRRELVSIALTAGAASVGVQEG